tara:strand:+ start:4304 stop:4693 length:390 start_codon:yes stop_codon:yes gene_type:complete
MLTIGDLDSQIQIQSGVSSQDEMGGSKIVWGGANIRNEYAKVEWKDGSSEENENRVSGITYIEFTIRDNGNADISANKFRVAFPILNGVLNVPTTQYYTVEGVRLWGGRNKWRTLICSVNSNDMNTYIG